MLFIKVNRFTILTLFLESLTKILTSWYIQEAMDEVDIDKSHTLDFYEYLLVVDKITKKSGMFKSTSSILKYIL